MTMHGPLSEIGLIEVLQLLERGGQSGMLRITGATPADTGDIRIAAGRIVAVDPAASDANTRRALVARFIVTEAEAADDPAMLERPAAHDMREQLAARALAGMLHWRKGRFDFESGAPQPGPLHLSADGLVFDLVATEGRRVDLAPALDEFRAVPRFAAADVLAAGEPPALLPLDWRVLDQVDGVRDVATIAATIDESIEDVATSVQALHGSLILELGHPDADTGRSARSAIEAGRYEEAASLLRARVVEHPGDIDAWRSLGLAEVGAGRFEHAIDAWQSWQASDPDRADDAVALMQAARTMVEALRDARD